MSPTGRGDALDEKKSEKLASSSDLHPSLAASATSTKGSQGKHCSILQLNILIFQVWLLLSYSPYLLLPTVFQSMKLLQNVTSTVHQVCRRLKMDEYKSNASTSNQSIKPGRLTPNSVHAVKNGRRKMEDRHVVIHDLNVIYSDPNNDVSLHYNWFLFNFDLQLDILNNQIISNSSFIVFCLQLLVFCRELLSQEMMSFISTAILFFLEEMLDFWSKH